MSKQDDARRKHLRRLIKDGATELAVASSDLRWLLDETSRLQQSNDRLRRQNRRLRLRAGEEDAEASSESGAPDSGAPGSGDAPI